MLANEYERPTESDLSLLYLMDFPNGKDKNGETRTGTLTSQPTALTRDQQMRPFQAITPIVGLTRTGMYHVGRLRRRSRWQ